MTSSAFSTDDGQGLPAVASFCQMLKHLEILRLQFVEGCCCNNGSSNGDDCPLSIIFEHGQQLKELEVSGKYCISSDRIKSCRLENIISLSMTSNSNFDDRCLEELIIKCKKLEYLDISSNMNITKNKNTKTYIETFSNLKSVNVCKYLHSLSVFERQNDNRNLQQPGNKTGENDSARSSNNPLEWQF